MNMLKEFLMVVVGCSLVILLFTRPIKRSKFAKNIRKKNTNSRYNMKLSLFLFIIIVVVSVTISQILNRIGLSEYEQLAFGICMGTFFVFSEAFGINEASKKARERI